MIINTNEITLKDSGLKLLESVIIGHNFSGEAVIGKAIITMQTNFYANAGKWMEGIGNYLKVAGYEQKQFIFEYPADSAENVFYFYDLQLKAYLMKCFPDWDESKLIITTEPAI